MNPMLMLLQAAAKGGNPMQALMGLAQSNPQLQQVMPFIQGKDPRQLEQTARNLYKERGMDINQAMQQIQSMMQTRR